MHSSELMHPSLFSSIALNKASTLQDVRLKNSLVDFDFPKI